MGTIPLHWLCGKNSIALTSAVLLSLYHSIFWCQEEEQRLKEAGERRKRQEQERLEAEAKSQLEEEKERFLNS